MNRLVFFALVNLFSIIAVSAAEATYLKVTAKNGDGAYSLLRRYDLLDEYCNLTQFYKLNHLKKDAQLFSGKKYNMPILIYKYDGNSIRTTIGNKDYDKALAIQKYNEAILGKKLRSQGYKESKLLWVPFSAIYCGSKKSPALAEQSSKQNSTQKTTTNTSKTPTQVQSSTRSTKVESASKSVASKNPKDTRVMKTHTIFGPNYSRYQEVDQALKGKVYYIVSGHGGPDPGAMCKTCPQPLCEDEYAYDVSLRLARNLMQHGAKVEIIIHDNNDGIRDGQYLKCDQDERCNGKPLPLKQKKRLEQRASRINALYAMNKNKGFKEHVVVAIHVDAAGQGARKDVFFYHHKNSKTGKKIANNIHNTFKAKYEKFQKGRGYKGTVRSRGLYMINNTTPPIVYIELANIHNPKDQQRIIKSSNRQALANWIFQGLIK